MLATLRRIFNREPVYRFRVDGRRRSVPVRDAMRALEFAGYPFAKAIALAGETATCLAEAKARGRGPVAQREIGRASEGARELARVARSVFALPALDRDTGKGVTEAEAATVLADFLCTVAEMHKPAGPRSSCPDREERTVQPKESTR